MKPLSLIVQIVVICLATAIVIFFVRPTFFDIGMIQNEIQQYAQERERVDETNANLAGLVSELESVSTSNRTRLVTYLPNSLDEVAVLRDIEIMAESTGVNYTVIEYVGELLDTSEEARMSVTESNTVAHEFSLSVEGTYQRLKDFLSLLEQNQYPLQVQTLRFSSTEGGFLLLEATVITQVSPWAEVSLR